MSQTKYSIKTGASKTFQVVKLTQREEDKAWLSHLYLIDSRYPHLN